MKKAIFTVFVSATLTVCLFTTLALANVSLNLIDNQCGKANMYSSVQLVNHDRHHRYLVTLGITRDYRGDTDSWSETRTIPAGGKKIIGCTGDKYTSARFTWSIQGYEQR